jgi:hypothetical protein
MDSSSLGPLATSGAGAITVCHSSAVRSYHNVIITVSNGVAFWWSPDGAVTWHYVAPTAGGNPTVLNLPNLDLSGHTLQVKRATSTDLTGVYCSAW